MYFLRAAFMQSIKWRDLCPERDTSQSQACRWTERPAGKNLYQVLEVCSSASPEVIRAAYRALMEKHHPDKNPEHCRSLAEEISCRLNHAYGVLSNPQKRRMYDLAHDIGPTT
jgi:DnaJ-domain-containing protein 1